ncbi:MAG: acylphosphatase [Spirochaetaceae bacterium]|jgi:acylphosphatase|nr:acylphosphatase [Spirochaetaceae bacterium]
MEITAFSAVIKGRVQGVGFRWTAAAEAERLGLKGWVRNTVDGDVEVWAEGTRENAAAFLSWLRHGPPRARVGEVHADWTTPAGSYRCFSVKTR